MPNLYLFSELIYLIDIFYVFPLYYYIIQLILNSLLTMFYLNTIVTKNIFQFFFSIFFLIFLQM